TYCILPLNASPKMNVWCSLSHNKPNISKTFVIFFERDSILHTFYRFFIARLLHTNSTFEVGSHSSMYFKNNLSHVFIVNDIKFLDVIRTVTCLPHVYCILFFVTTMNQVQMNYGPISKDQRAVISPTTTPRMLKRYKICFQRLFIRIYCSVNIAKLLELEYRRLKHQKKELDNITTDTSISNFEACGEEIEKFLMGFHCDSKHDRRCELLHTGFLNRVSSAWVAFVHGVWRGQVS
ncbi:hypothetical protein L9F63_001719, partial [Diploptera punctata]